jgi:hypothetical protein
MYKPNQRRSKTATQKQENTKKSYNKNSQNKHPTLHHTDRKSGKQTIKLNGTKCQIDNIIPATRHGYVTITIRREAHTIPAALLDEQDGCVSFINHLNRYDV